MSVLKLLICKHYFKMNIYRAEANLLDYPYIIY